MKFSNRIIGIAAVLGALAIVFGTFEFREVPGQQFGSAFFPRITAGAMALTGIALIGASHVGPLLTLPGWMRSAEGLRAVAMPAVGLLWVFAAPVLGFLLSTFLLIGALALLAGGRIVPAFCVAAGMTTVLHLVFGELLRVPLPLGVIEGWLL